MSIECTQSMVGAVVIGRNEGARLTRCLRSLVDRAAPIVYVDSGSSDRSVATARCLGAEVLELDTSIPFTAARARNAGFRHLLAAAPGVELVQFLDGDCEVVDGWLQRGREYLTAHEDVAVVSGRRREREPESSVYNLLCEMEWDTPIGEVGACHGDAMMRVDAVQQIGGFREEMIAGEEPELCVRLRRAGWRIMRLDAEMTLHDAAMVRFGQWWRRNVRAGHAYAEGAWLHGRSEVRHNLRAVCSSLGYASAPMVALAAAPWTNGISLALLLVHPVLYWRVRQHRLARGDQPRPATTYACFCVIAKFAHGWGIVKFVIARKLLRRGGRLIEYKQVETPGRTSPRSV